MGAKKSILKLLLPIIIIASFIVMLIGLISNKSETTSQSGWTLQTNLQSQLRGRNISDMTFTDSVTGYAVTPWVYNDSAFIFKTTNGGDNWFINVAQSNQQGGFKKIIFINKNTGFNCGNYLRKTTNEGLNWDIINTGGISAENMYLLNENTIYLTNSEALDGGLFRTTNGGQNWEKLWSAGNDNPKDIYMYNSRIGFLHGISSFLYKTTDGGYNWFVINDGGFIQIQFFDSLMGFRTKNGFNKTINGGYNWETQVSPIVPGVTTTGSVTKFQFNGIDTIIGVGGSVWYPNPGRYRGLIYKTTNGGINWGYQLPDTHNIQIISYQFINFIGNKYGWAYNSYGPGIHTTTGGDSTIYVGINKNETSVSGDYILYQNYPNPFNPVTSIKYQVLKSAELKIIVFDITGKEISTLINKKQAPGTYEVKFDARHGGSSTELSSGIYFYALFISEVKVDVKKLLLIK